MAEKCFVNSVAQVSCQAALSDSWFDRPEYFTESFVRSKEPDWKGIIPPGEARRMGKILKRSICSSEYVLKEGGIDMPDGIITGTAMGCIENSEKFLEDLSRYGEKCLKPSLFMQSTHNTISSLIAIFMKCHGYNNTFSHKGLSFESALLDAWLQIRQGIINTALVGAHDEVTPLMNRVLKKTHPEYSFITETSVSCLLTNSYSHKSICEITNIELFHKEELNIITEYLDNIGTKVLVLGVNGNKLNDSIYNDLIKSLSFKPTIVQYKKLFGDNYSSSAFGFYVGVTLIKKQSIPEFLIYRSFNDYSNISEITILNNSEDSWGLITLKAI